MKYKYFTKEAVQNSINEKKMEVLSSIENLDAETKKEYLETQISLIKKDIKNATKQAKTDFDHEFIYFSYVQLLKALEHYYNFYFNGVIELNKEETLKRLGYTLPNTKVFIVRGVGYVGACEIITEGQGAFGIGGRAVVLVKNFIKFCRDGFIADHVPNEYLIKRFSNTKITDTNINNKVLKAVSIV